jgi:hypothetical protein
MPVREVLMSAVRTAICMCRGRLKGVLTAEASAEVVRLALQLSNPVNCTKVCSTRRYEFRSVELRAAVRGSRREAGGDNCLIS